MASGLKTLDGRLAAVQPDQAKPERMQEGLRHVFAHRRTAGLPALAVSHAALTQSWRATNQDENGTRFRLSSRQSPRIPIRIRPGRIGAHPVQVVVLDCVYSGRVDPVAAIPLHLQKNLLMLARTVPKDRQRLYRMTDRAMRFPARIAYAKQVGQKRHDGHNRRPIVAAVHVNSTQRHFGHELPDPGSFPAL